MKRRDNLLYDLVVIGGGSAGLTAAGFAARLGRSVSIVERERFGGDCTWTGCVPSKTLLRTARVAHEMRHADRFGLQPFEPDADLSLVMGHVRSVIEEIYRPESPEALQVRGIDTYLASAKFADSNTIIAGETRIRARKILIATGARPSVPPITGLDGVAYLTYKSVWELKTLPGHLLVVGGGPVGCELAQAFRRLGSRVTLLEAADRILLQDEPEVSTLMRRVLTQEGVDLQLGAPVEEVSQDDTGVHLTAAGRRFTGDILLLAAGRQPGLSDLELERAGVAYGSAGVEIDSNLKTSQRNVYAAGDCTGGHQFTHYAARQGFMAARNALLSGNSRGVLKLAPWATFTSPEVAHAGLSEAQAREQFGNGVQVAFWPMDRVDRAITDGNSEGFIKVVSRSNGRLVGATVVNDRAGEAIHQWILAIDQGMNLGDLTNFLHIYPTYSMAGMQLAAEKRVSRLLAGLTGKIIRAWPRRYR